MSEGLQQGDVSPKDKSSIDVILWSSRILNPFDDPVEIRAFEKGKSASGYFMDRQKLAEAAMKLDSQGFQVYVTLNRVDKTLYQNAPERLVYFPKRTTSDSDITRRIWLAVDLDPTRPSGVSATDEEKKAAQEAAREIREYLALRDWSDPIVADSGNGMHLLYPIDLDNSPESLNLVKNCLEALASDFDNDKVNVDVSVANAGRIWKLYGCVAKKGENTPERPHRISRILEVPEYLKPF